MATLKQIAHEVGVDISTVSYVLNGKAARLGISAERAGEIEAAARRLNYRPNVAARAMQQGRFGTVALLQGTRWGMGHIPPNLLDGIALALEGHDLRLLFTRASDERLTDARVVPKLLRELSCDGLLITYNELIPPHLIELIAAHRVPAVWINSRQAADCVFPDEHDAGRRAGEHLLRLGHRRIAYQRWNGTDPDPARAHFSVLDRRAGVEGALRAAGLRALPGFARPARVVDADGRLAAAMRWLSAPARPDAVVTYAGSDAELVATAAAKLGLRIPDDLSLVCFANVQPSVLGVPIDTLLIPDQAMGAAAVAMLVQRIAHPEQTLPPRPIALPFVAGRSSAAPSPH